MNKILDEIIQQKALEITYLKKNELKVEIRDCPPSQDFIKALIPKSNQYVHLIAELKIASPSKGFLAPNMEMGYLAEIYQENGASAISVLTDQKFFRGNIKILRDLRQNKHISLPLLRKDFIIDEVQLYETRANGADAVLLIAAALPDDYLLADLHACALELGLTPLVEVHTQSEVERILRLKGLCLVGINNRNLDTFEIDLNVTTKLRPLIPKNITLIAESGIFTRQDVDKLGKLGLHAILVGEALVTSQDIASKVRELSSRDCDL